MKYIKLLLLFSITNVCFATQMQNDQAKKDERKAKIAIKMNELRSINSEVKKYKSEKLIISLDKKDNQATEEILCKNNEKYDSITGINACENKALACGFGCYLITLITGFICVIIYA